jgi:hypothetical protein
VKKRIGYPIHQASVFHQGVPTAFSSLWWVWGSHTPLEPPYPRLVDPSGVKATRFLGRPFGRVRWCTAEFWGFRRGIISRLLVVWWGDSVTGAGSSTELSIDVDWQRGGRWWTGQGCPKWDRWGNQGASPVTGADQYDLVDVRGVTGHSPIDE